jgi:cytochrome c peroxidase
VHEVSADDLSLLKRAQNLFAALPETSDRSTEKALLGQQLYFEKALSINNEMSCNTCHQLEAFGVDGEPTSPGHAGVRGDRNSPTVYNAGYHIAQFWDGRAADLSEQAKGPILNPIEMGIPDEKTAVERIKAIKGYAEKFNYAFPNQAEPITYQNIATAIGDFEKSLITPSRFDEYLRGQLTALSTKERKGLHTFLEVGCASCHAGIALGGNQYQKFGLVQGPYNKYTKSSKEDAGRFSLTKQEADLHVFKVPSLRNIEKTAPYFHDGSVADLASAVKIMGTTQLGVELSDTEVADIMAFLNSLTGELLPLVAVK